MHRVEGLAKLTGAERYIDDVPEAELPGGKEGVWWGMTVRSSAPRGLIRAIRFRDAKALDWSRLVIVDHRDIPGPNVTYLIEQDQPVLAAREVRHVHEPIVLIAGPHREEVRRAVASVQVEIEPLPAVLDYRVEPRPEQIQWGTDNVLKRILLEKGDARSAIERAPVVVEGVYETGAQEHVYIEPQGMIAWVEPGPPRGGAGGDVVVVRGSMQCPYYVLNALKHALGRDASRVRVIQAPTGGGFGGKEDYPSTLALHAALLAMKSGHTVKMIYDRGEDMAATTKRHPSRVRIRTGVDRDGRLLGQEIDVRMDGGAYVTLSPVVLSRGVIHAAGPYFCEHVRIDAKAMLSNAVPFGAFRGFGAPQTQFAGERQMDRIADRLGMDPIELRKRNLLRDGQTTATGQLIKDGVDRVALLDEAVRARMSARERAAHEAFNASSPHLRRGLGVSCVLHGAGFTGNGEIHLASRLRVAGLPDGRVEVLSASTEMGQGTTTVFTQVAARTLGYEARDVVVDFPDTSRVPNSGPTVASRTAMVVGGLIERACRELAAKASPTDAGNGAALRGAALKDAIRAWHAKNAGKALVAEVAYEHPAGLAFDEKTYKGDAYATYSWGACVAEVEVDLRTCGVRVIDLLVAIDAGTILHPVLARGQVQGGIVQGIGWALMEECVMRDGAMANNQLTNYIIPTSDDVPAIRVVFRETPYARGGGGAKGLGELPMDPPAPAILAAVASATGTDPRVIPLTPERLLALVELKEPAHA